MSRRLRWTFVLGCLCSFVVPVAATVVVILCCATFSTASAARRLAPGPPSFARTRASSSRTRAARARSVSIDTASRAADSGVNSSWINSGTIFLPAIRLTIPIASTLTSRRPS